MTTEYKARLQKVSGRAGFKATVRRDEVIWFIHEDNYDINAYVVVGFFQRRGISMDEVFIAEGYTDL